MKILEYNTILSFFEKSLEQKLRYKTTPIELMSPMMYSLLNGGKRIRPVLLLWILAIQSMDDLKLGLNTAIALEMIHTYSLIHDDLPAMDNDDLRRGIPTNHKQFDEATAILAGDALLTDAFGMIVEDHLLNSEQKVQLVQLLSQAAGSVGMVAGQLKDMQAEQQVISLETLERIHYLKTGKLFIFAVQAAVIIAQLSEQEKNLLTTFATHFGTAFQIHNDIMDVIGSYETTGKQVHADDALQKATYPSLLTLDGAKTALQTQIEQAQLALNQLSELTNQPYDTLSDFLKFLSLEQ